MNTFKRKSLHAAVLAGLGAVGFAGTANAVHVAQDGLGSVLLYPYYTVRADGGGNSTAFYDTLLSVVNTTTSFKAVKVRFMEGKRSQEVLDFNLFLSPRDVWTGAVTRTSDGARLVSSDRSCVVPTTLFSTDPANTLNSFKNFLYASPTDGGGTTLDRTREGHFEIIEMGVFTNATATAAALHNSAGTPANCAFFQANDQIPANYGLIAPAGGLAGGASLINVQAGTDYSYDAVALANWSNTSVYGRAGDTLPNLGSGTVFTSTVFRADGSVVVSDWGTSGLNAVSAALMSQNVINEYVLETATSSGTDWVVTFPTKSILNGYVRAGTGAAAAPFNANFNNGQSCDVFGFQFWNREEQTPGVTTVVLPSPEPPITPSVNTLCFQTNVVTFANSNNLGSTNGYNVPVDTFALNPTNRTGWGLISFNVATLQRLTATGAGNTINGAAAASITHFGLPVIGFAIQDFANGNVGGVLSNYGGLFSHKYVRNITTP